MIPATVPRQRPEDARLLVVDRAGEMRHVARRAFIQFLNPGDLVIANDAATIPASLTGTHAATGNTIEVRLAGRDSLSPQDVNDFTAIIFGAGDYRVPTEERELPPTINVADRLILGSLTAEVTAILDHPRLLKIHFHAAPDSIWSGLARYGRPIQYSYLSEPLQQYDVWTRIAAQPVAFEPPSAGFVLDWQMIEQMHTKRVEFTTITHAAGISSTGDAELDKRLPFVEPYTIPASTVAAIRRAKRYGKRVIAIGTTVVRALEDAATKAPTIQHGNGIATIKIGPETNLRIVDAIFSGTHEPGTSHYELLRAFLNDHLLQKSIDEIERHHYRTHEFGDSVLINAGV